MRRWRVEAPTITIVDVQAIRQACDYIESIPKDRFDYSIVTEERACGTVGCLAGWMSILDLDWPTATGYSQELQGCLFLGHALGPIKSVSHKAPRHTVLKRARRVCELIESGKLEGFSAKAVQA